MIGDAVARGKRGNTKAHGPEFKQKNSRGQSYKHAQPSTGKDDTDSGGHHEQRHTAKRMHKGMKPHGTGTFDKQAPHKQKERKEVRHVDQGNILDEWCRGKRGCYK